MSLTGALDAFPLPDVLGLLARSAKTGTLRIDAPDLRGRLYMANGLLTYATTRNEEDLAEDLAGAGLIDSQDWVFVERREKNVVQILNADATEQQLTELLSDQIADVIFRLMRRTDGDFEFSEAVGPSFETGVAIEVDRAIEEAVRRIATWEKIEEVIPAVGFHLRMVPTLTERNEVTLPATDWRILAALHGEGSIEEVARRLGMTDFTVGQSMAGMTRQGLLEIIDMPPTAAYGYGEEDRAKPSSAYAEPESKKAPKKEPERNSEEEPEKDSELVDTSEDDEILLAGALSKVVSGNGEADRPAVSRRRGLGARVQEAKDASE
jgi:AraC-like DNA-binding protein